MPLQQSKIQKSHNWFLQREMSYVITVRATEEDVMLSSLYITLLGGVVASPHESQPRAANASHNHVKQGQG